MAARHLVRRRPRNLTTYRFYKELTGHQSDMMFMVPEEGLNKMPYGKILRALRILEAALQRNEVPRVTIMAHLKVLMDQLHAGQDPLGETSDTSEVTTIIQKHGGVQTLLSLLMVKDLGGRCCFLETCQHNLNVGSLHAVTLDILRKLSLELHSGARLSESDEVLQILFSLMLDEETYTKAIALVEHLLIFRKSTLQLNTIPGLDRLIAKLDGQYLANFCSILAVTISDLDVYENKTLLYEQSKLRSNIKSLSPLRDINQEFILRIPHFLSRLVDFATKLPYEPRYSGLTMEVEHWMRLIEDSMREVLRAHQNQQPSSSGSPSATPQTNPRHLMDLMNRIQPQTIANQIDSLTGPMLQRVESVYVLGLLLLGKQRKEVQVQLARLRLIPRLSSLFDLFIWKCETYQERIRVPGHLSSCECSPEVALKIQFLRLVHSFCDQSDYRYLMLTPKEFSEVRKIHIHYGREDNFSLHPSPSPSQSPTTVSPESSNGNEPAKSNLPCNDNSQPERTEEWAATNIASQARPLVEYPAEQMCSGSKGLLLKIVEALKKETTGSTFRFWFSRAIESYLRSPNPYADQVFLLRRGLLKHLAGSLLQCDPGPNQKEVLQSTFDLLGELLKFNDKAYKRLDSLIAAEFKEKQLFSLVTKNLVDSNMLVRSLVLSHDYFVRVQGAEAFVAKSRTLHHVSTFRQRLSFLVQLIKTISVDTLTQENVSCLNTSLVILMLAHKHSELPLYLEALRTHVEPHLLTNLRSLLRFWQTHYLHNKDKDCNTLQRSSGISFDFWRETVATLVAEKKLSPDCIYHYLSPEDLTLSRTS
ncbi:hypothetical protein O3P69_001519 [Scylla paramamosain]|uniref:Short transient receptor potential channel 4-associated protein n=1 Tax=Scylla paramamosain TaxID=85552 RepID=A0AAW0V0M8_SCYPA